MKINILKKIKNYKNFSPFFTALFFVFGLYDLKNIKPTMPHLSRFGFALISCFIVGIFLFYFIPVFGISPKTNLLFQVLGFGLFSFLFRRIFYLLFANNITRPVILIGKTNNIKEFAHVITNNPQFGLHIISQVENLKEILQEENFYKNHIFIIENGLNVISPKEITNIYQNKNEILNIEEAYEKYLDKIPVDFITSSWIIENINIKQNIIYSLLLRIIDIVFSIMLLVLSSPLLLISAIIVHAQDNGPVFIKQKRVGKNGKIFNLHKMRSMIVLSPDGLAEKDNKEQWTEENDPRITPFGKYIRKTHIDEIPQMINILRGDISLVGPRPERPEFVAMLEQNIPNYELRHLIKPGFTGWAQIKYRYARTINDSKEKFEYDLYYIKNRNIFLDFAIFLKTIQIVFTH